MSKALPTFLDPWRFADRDLHLSGRLPQAALARLVALLDQPSPTAEVVYQLHFFRDEQRRVRVEGWVRSEVILRCQRCLGPLPLSLSATISLGVVSDLAEVEGLPEGVEPLLIESAEPPPGGGRRHEVRYPSSDLLEDELLLLLPYIPLHPEGACSAAGASSPQERPEPEAEQQRENPFAVLAELKGR